LRFLVRMLPGAVSHDGFLPSIRSLAKSVGVDARNPKWTSYGALELDIFSQTKPDFELFLATAGPLARFEFVKDLNVAPPHKEDAELLDEARLLFNGERYWECHEVLEGLWRQKVGDEKRLLQGVILVCAAFVHHQKGEEAVALGVLRRALPLLARGSRSYGGIDIDRMKESVEAALSQERFSDFLI